MNLYISLFLLLMLSPKMDMDKPTEVSGLQQSSVDFKATGNEPSWSLEIDFDQKMHFKSLNHPYELITPVPNPELNPGESTETYHAVTESGELLVTITRKICKDPMSGTQYPSSVSVLVKRITDDDFAAFAGCGGRLLDSRLHNIWALEEMEGNPVTSEDFGKEIPTLEIFANEGRVGGQDGCNRLSGKINGNENQLEFGMLMSTRMACPKMEKSNQFLKLINQQQYEYHFEPRMLVLSKAGKAILKFRNID